MKQSSPTPRRKPKRLTESKPLLGQIARLSMQDFRDAPGDAITQVQMGKVYVITKNDQPVAVLQALPGDRLTIVYDGKGHVTYEP